MIEEIKNKLLDAENIFKTGNICQSFYTYNIDFNTYFINCMDI